MASSPTALSEASSLHSHFFREPVDNVSPAEEKVNQITGELQKWGHFDVAAKRYIQDHPLYPNQAQKVISFVAHEFGEEAALWTLEKLKGSFATHDWWHGRKIYPLNQIKVLRTFCWLGDVKVALQVLKEMEFYQESSEHPMRSAYEDLGLDETHVKNGDEKQHSKPIYGHDFLAKPIILLGNKFGLEAAKAALQELRSHICIKDERVQDQIETYFKEKFGEEAGNWARHQMTYRVKLADLCVVS
jgi:hypothetical protein